MLMICQGPACGKVFEAKRKNAKWCSKRCSMAASRAGQLGEPTPAPAGAAAPARPGSQGRRPVEIASKMLPATREALERVGRQDSWAGRAALVLAERIDLGGAETGSALASMIKEYAQAMDRALATAAPDDPVQAREDEIAERRRRHDHDTGTG